MLTRLAPVVAALVVATALASGAAADELRCAGLGGFVVDQATIGLPTRGAVVESATLDGGMMCVTRGSIISVDSTAPNIHFAINLPRRWNGKAVHVGGGGFDGVLVDARHPSVLPEQSNPLATGYATFGSDSGHTSRASDPLTVTLDASFATNAEALGNFAGAQLKKVHDVAVAVIHQYYGRRPRRLYFYGVSQGGHEGMIVAQRYPMDYDGVVSLFPAYDFIAIVLSDLSVAQHIYSRNAWMSPAKTAFLGDRVLKACDGLDGVLDGIVSNVAACRRAFHIQDLRCSAGSEERTDCLSDAQIAALEFASGKMSFGFEVGSISEFSAWPVFEGAFSPGTAIGFGIQAQPDRPPSDKDSVVWRIADQAVRYLITRDASHDSLTFDPTHNVAAVQRVATLVDSSSTDLDSFKQRGGKLLLMHGTVDMTIPPGNSVAYYEGLKIRYGEALRDFVRFYMLPGYGHGDGPFQASWDSLAALDSWVEGHHPPAVQVVFDVTPGHGGRSRPLCEYPQWPKYEGEGTPQNAANFHCVSD